MSAGQISRAMAVLEVMFQSKDGRSVSDIAEEVGISAPAAFRILDEFAALGYLRQDQQTRLYSLSFKLPGLAYQHWAKLGIRDAVQPVLDRLAATMGELVRLAAVEDGKIMYVAMAQGRKTGLRYEPVNGDSVPLFCTATGQSFLASIPDDEAARLIALQGMEVSAGFGPNAPKTLAETMVRVEETRRRGYGFVTDSYSPGMTALAALVRSGRGRVVGVASIAIPTARFDEGRMPTMTAALLAAADELSNLADASGHFRFESGEDFAALKYQK